MASETPTSGTWFGSAEIGRLRGRVFKWTCLGATVLTLFLMLVFLLYVANDALAPLSADPGWLATMGLAVVVPVVLLAGYYYRRDRSAGEVAYTALGLPIFVGLVAGGIWLLFRHIVTPQEWFVLIASVLVAGGLVTVHSRLRHDAAVERLAVMVLAPLLAVVGVPTVVPSLRELLSLSPVLPNALLSLVIGFLLPIAALVGWRVRTVRDVDRDGAIAAGVTVAGGLAGTVVGPLLGVHPTSWIVFASPIVGALVLYVERVVRNGEGVSGLAFPVVVAAGVFAGLTAAQTLGFAGPDAWLDMQFLTSSTSTTPADAGIYPALVGSVLIMIVIVLSAFPVGVGAAVYLEEYARAEGPLGKVIELIQVNIANLAGVPSIVYGVLGLAIFINLIGMGRGTAVVAGFTVGLLILPIVIISTQEAIRAVPDSHRQASYAMGATKWQTVRNVVLPESLAGIFTGTILALGRAIGETAPLLMIGVSASVRVSPDSFLTRTGAMPRQILSWSTQITTEFRYGVLAAGVVTLLVVLLTMNTAAIVLRNRSQQTQ
ncbi:MAG: phosphate ABC transporter permease PstA [Halorubrum sp.]|uniref:phosphate ABC transporter permease PstA n=1 Tax=Halorubrum sp. TaxID=1879286 RepID=UPI003970D861